MNYNYSESWYETFMPAHSAEITLNEINFIKKFMPLTSYPKILDVCCGTGRHSINLALAGYDVVGIDINSSALQKGKENINKEMKIQFLLHDMREIFSLKSKFDGILCLWQSYGFFDTKTNEFILKQINDILNSSGRFILDIFNYDFFIRHQGKYDFIRNNIQISETKTILDNRLYITLEYHELQKIDHYQFQIFKPKEIISLAEKHEFNFIKMCTNFDSNTLPNENIPRMQFVFEKL